jgi:hypothetical protein
MIILNLSNKFDIASFSRFGVFSGFCVWWHQRLISETIEQGSSLSHFCGWWAKHSQRLNTNNDVKSVIYF